MTQSITFSEWLGREINILTDNHSLKYFRNRFDDIDFTKLQKWYEETKPDLKNMSLERALDETRRMK